MRIMFVAPYFYPKIGGLENYVLNIAKGMQESNEVIVVTTTSQKRVLKEDFFGLKVYRLPFWLKISNTPIDLGWYAKLGKIIENERPDIINIHMPVPGLGDVAAKLASKKKIPFVVTYHAGTMKKEKSLLNLLIKIYEKSILGYSLDSAKSVICSSPFVKDNFLVKWKEKCFVITPGVDIESINKIKQKESSDFTVLYIGKIDSSAKWKGVNFLLDAFTEMTKKTRMKLVLIGGGNMVSYYRKKYPSRNISFKGILPWESVIKEIKRSAILILPSTSEAESFGMVLAEANACGKPVIATDIGGIPCFVRNNFNGVLITPRSSKEIAKSILMLRENKAYRALLGRNGKKFVGKEFLWKDKVKQTEDVFSRVLAKLKSEGEEK